MSVLFVAVDERLFFMLRDDNHTVSQHFEILSFGIFVAGGQTLT